MLWRDRDNAAAVSKGKSAHTPLEASPFKHGVMYHFSIFTCVFFFFFLAKRWFLFTLITFVGFYHPRDCANNLSTTLFTIWIRFIHCFGLFCLFTWGQFVKLTAPGCLCTQMRKTSLMLLKSLTLRETNEVSVFRLQVTFLIVVCNVRQLYRS